MKTSSYISLTGLAGNKMGNASLFLSPFTRMRKIFLYLHHCGENHYLSHPLMEELAAENWGSRPVAIYMNNKFFSFSFTTRT
jgi:hypothetical protein